MELKIKFKDFTSNLLKTMIGALIVQQTAVTVTYGNTAAGSYNYTQKTMTGVISYMEEEGENVPIIVSEGKKYDLNENYIVKIEKGENVLYDGGESSKLSDTLTVYLNLLSATLVQHDMLKETIRGILEHSKPKHLMGKQERQRTQKLEMMLKRLMVTRQEMIGFKTFFVSHFCGKDNASAAIIQDDYSEFSSVLLDAFVEAQKGGVDGHIRLMEYLQGYINESKGIPNE